MANLHHAGFPVFSVCLARATSPLTSPPAYHIVVGGGGGPTKSGIKNGLILYSYSAGSLKTIATIDSQDEAVMCLALQKVSPLTVIAGVGPRGWRVACQPDGDGGGKPLLLLLCSVQTDHGGQEDPHQRMVSVKGRRVATAACDGAVRVWSVDDVNGWEAEEVLSFPGAFDTVTDVQWYDGSLWVVINHSDVLECIEDSMGKWQRRTLNHCKRENHSVRFCRATDDLLLIISNNRPKKCAVIEIFEKQSLKLLSTIALKKLVTACWMSEYGFLAIGCSDGHVAVYSLDGTRSKLLMQHSHSFAVTSVYICEHIVVSGSADGSVFVGELLQYQSQIDITLLILLSIFFILSSHLLHSYNYQFKLL